MTASLVYSGITTAVCKAVKQITRILCQELTSLNAQLVFSTELPEDKHVTKHSWRVALSAITSLMADRLNTDKKMDVFYFPSTKKNNNKQNKNSMETSVKFAKQCTI